MNGSSETNGGWSPIESDPVLFTEFIHELGTPSLQANVPTIAQRLVHIILLWCLQEVLSLEDESLISGPPIYGLIFLFKWSSSPASDKSWKPPNEEYQMQSGNLYFSKQVPQEDGDRRVHWRFMHRLVQMSNLQGATRLAVVVGRVRAWIASAQHITCIRILET